jgi:hypothetical protein
MEKYPAGATIITHGQKVKILFVEELSNDAHVYHLEHPIVVPSIQYTKNYVYDFEIDMCVSN